MSDAGDMNQSILDLSAEEKRAFSYLFTQADTDQLGVVTGERAVSFFERTKVSPTVLGEIWQIADTENRGLLTKPGFCIVLRLIGHYQAGRAPSTELAFKSGPVPRFEGLNIPGIQQGEAAPSPTTGQFAHGALQPQLSGQGPIRVPPLDPQKGQQYSGLFERSGAQNGTLDGATAKSIFDRAGLPNEVLGRIWNLSDREQRGALDQTEFIVAMHLLTSMKTRTMTALPATLPPGLYEAAARRGAPPPPGSRGSTGPGVVPRQFSGGAVGAPARTQSPLARPPSYATPTSPLQSAQTTGTPWLVTPPEKVKYDQFFSTIDTQGRGVITGEQAVRFFSDSRLPEETLASIWDLADINSEGQLNKDEFAVAMYLIRQQRGPNAPTLPAFLPSALIPPSMRSQQQQAQSTAPAFDNANNTSNLTKSASEDLFGLDQPNQPQFQPQQTGFQPAGLGTQTTGASSARDQFAGSQPGSPGSPQRFQPQPQQANTAFKPFMPTSAFGASLAQQHTGGSTTSSQGQVRAAPHPQTLNLQQPSAMDDLLGDNDAHAEENSKLTNESTELANMSNQIGNLRTQMEQSQSKKAATQQDLNATNTQKRDLELRLQQFRTQYEQEVRAVKELDQQLSASRDSTKKLGQDLAMLEGTYQDLQTQHNNVAQALQADQQENANLKQKITEINAEVARLKPEIEKMKLDARQQKGLVSINKKQLATNEGDRDRLQNEKADLEREATEREEQARNAPAEESTTQQPLGRDAAIAGAVGAASVGAYEVGKRSGSGDLMSPGPATGASTLSSTNPFFRTASSDTGAADRSMNSPRATSPTPSAFDTLFGPSAAFPPSGSAGTRTGTPPTTSFVGRSTPTVSSATRQQPGPAMTDSVQSISSAGEPTPSATPPLSDPTKESPQTAEPPPPPENRQFTPSHLPVGGLAERGVDDSEASSTRVMPPASRAGGTETPREPIEPEGLEEVDRSPPAQEVEERVPGAFLAEEPQPMSSAKDVSAGPSTAAFTPPPPPPAAAAASSSRIDDFDSAFAGFGENEKAKSAREQEQDRFAAPFASQQQEKGVDPEFPPIRNLESEDEDDSEEEEAERAFHDSLTQASPQPNGVTAAPGEHKASEVATATALAVATGEDIASTRPNAQSIESTASNLPTLTSQQSPPSYEESNDASHGDSGERTRENQFPPEFDGLLPARGDPTSPPPPSVEPPEQSLSHENANVQPQRPQTLQPTSSTGQSLFPSVQTPSVDIFHDAQSRPISSFTDVTPTQQAQISQAPAQAKSAFDEFDEFGDLSEAKEADKNNGDEFDFGFSHRSTDHDFNPTFDSPPASMTNTMTSSQQTPIPAAKGPDSIGFANFEPTSSGTVSGGVFGSSGNGSIQHTPQNVQHDWDAIFSGLDSSKNVDTSLAGSDDPWGTATTAVDNTTLAANGSGADKAPTTTSRTGTLTTKAQMQPLGRALTPSTEHDDPILKRLTGMGYPRGDALSALEMYDYDINKAVDHLTSS